MKKLKIKSEVRPCPSRQPYSRPSRGRVFHEPSRGRYLNRNNKHNHDHNVAGGPGGKKLSKKKMAELHAAGKCFTCEEVGHLSRNCPSRNQVAGGSSSKPPGIPSFSMTMDLIEDVDDTDILESMLLGMIMMDGPESTCFRPNLHLDFFSFYQSYPSVFAGPSFPAIRWSSSHFACKQ